jgi:hypothetical protein
MHWAAISAQISFQACFECLRRKARFGSVLGAATDTSVNVSAHEKVLPAVKRPRTVTVIDS